MPAASFSSRYNGYAYNLGYVSKCAKKGNGLNKSSQIKKTTFIQLVFRLVTLVNVDIVLILNWTLEMMHKQMSKPLAIYMFTLLHSYTRCFSGSRSHFKLMQLSSALMYRKNHS